jgi:hypothetical protein
MQVPLFLFLCLWASSYGHPSWEPRHRLLPNLSRAFCLSFFTADTGFGAGGFLIRNLDEPEQGAPSQLVAWCS